jgi:hypothetical protein
MTEAAWRLPYARDKTKGLDFYYTVIMNIIYKACIPIKKMRDER